MTRIIVPLRMTYAEYISSSLWYERRAQQLERDSHRCQGCGSENDLNVHHKTYDRLGSELPDDLVTVCEVCHGFIHREQERTRRPLHLVTDAVLALISQTGRTQPLSWVDRPHTPRHEREPSDWRQDARDGGTWARGVPHRDEALAAMRANGVSHATAIQMLGGDNESEG